MHLVGRTGIAGRELMPRTFIVTATPPTTNGDLHAGHLSGPYLAADAFCRARALDGDRTVYVSSGDDHQTYVVTSAAPAGVAPAAMAQRFNQEIVATLRAADIAPDVFDAPDGAHDAAVQGFFERMHARGSLVERDVETLWCERCARALVEAYVTGECAVCTLTTKGNICEACGHPNDPAALIAPRCTADASHPVVRRTIRSLVLDLERHRAALERYVQTREGWRPHVLQLARELLAQPLQPYRVTFPSDWGTRCTIAGFEDQVYNPWAEMLPGLMHSTSLAEGRAHAYVEDAWRRDAELVQFLGYDNSYFFVILHVAMLADVNNGVLLPHAIVTNEFYQLHHKKFSTSLRNVIWGRDLLARQPVDAVRFYLCLSNPELQQTNFSPDECAGVARRRFSEPWAKLVDALVRADLGAGHVGADDAGTDAARRMTAFERRMRRAYALPTFSLRDAAETWAAFLERLVREAEAGPHEERTAREERSARELVLGAALLAIAAQPMMPSFARNVLDALGVRHGGEWFASASADPRNVARLAGGAAAPVLA
ncbi:MAG: hypothetical protein JWM87_3437 [Candidatus Eremiobacteraeota bacterium]|nr:hypothetical protein [Candidatus Eremiobacteraeota bacterium]